MNRERPNFHCNFRAPGKEWFLIWLEMKEATKARGLDICFVVLSLCRAWLEALKKGQSGCRIELDSHIVFIHQSNMFNYNVQKPRRERYLRDCSKNLQKCTICSRAFQAYIMEKARDLDRAFSFMDFTEINHDLFRKLILEPKKRQKIVALEPRTNPQFYILHEWKDRYPTMSENNRVKPNFTGDNDESSEKQEGGF
jgi:hypothetical protein